MDQYITNAARQELALREAAKTGNRHMRRKGAKIFRDVPPPRPWFAFEHPTYGTIGIRPAAAGAQLELRLPGGIPDDERAAVVEWGIEELKKMAVDLPAQGNVPCSDADS